MQNYMHMKMDPMYKKNKVLEEIKEYVIFKNEKNMSYIKLPGAHFQHLIYDKQLKNMHNNTEYEKKKYKRNIGHNLNHSISSLVIMIQSKITQIARYMWPTWGQYGADRTQVGPMLAPWTLLSGSISPPSATILSYAMLNCL